MESRGSALLCFLGMNEISISSRTELINALERHQREFGLTLTGDVVERLADYYELVQSANTLLHLVAPCSSGEFATRHILESLTLLQYLPNGAKFVDVGPGAGLPSIPCLVAREDLKVALIESKSKKAQFLVQTLHALDLTVRAFVVNKQFSETTAGNASHVTCRALDRFAENVPRLIKWAGSRTMLLFGGNNVAEVLRARGRPFETKLMAMSDQRYLFILPGGRS